MESKYYVGITGLVNVEEVQAITSEFNKTMYNLDSNHIPMIGFLVSLKTLNRQPVANRRYPLFDDLRVLVESAHGSVFPMIHYNSREPNLSEQLGHVFEGIYQEGLCRAVQLNIVYPNKKELSEVKKKMPELQIVFQASNKVIDGKNAKETAQSIQNYGSLIDYLLIDPSGGRGREFDLENSVHLYEEIRIHIPHVLVGFAGGFTENNVASRVRELKSKIGDFNFCIDSEGGLRDKLTDSYGDDLLNIEKARQYLQEAFRVLN